MQIPPSIREELKKPLGEIHRNFLVIKKLSLNHRIISVGDVCTLGLLAEGIRPHLAVFDHISMRNKLDEDKIKILDFHFPDQKKYKNPAGTISEKLLADAPKLIKVGGGILIEGEEDLTALAFVRSADSEDIIVYGQPNLGMVVVTPNKKIKKKIEKWLLASSSAPLGHKV